MSEQIPETPSPETEEQNGPEPETPAEPTPEEQEAEEAEQVEGHPGEEEPPQEPSGAAGAVGEKELEKMFAKVEQANVAYIKRIGQSMGEEFSVLEPCPRCAAPFFGLIFPPAMKQVDEATKAAVLLSVGEEVEDELEQDPYSRQCDICKGRGYTRTGAVLNSQKRIMCLPCKGRGWVAAGDERRVPQQAVTETTPDNGAVSPVEQPPDHDPWGRGPEHPDYGRLPQFVGAR